MIYRGRSIGEFWQRCVGAESVWQMTVAGRSKGVTEDTAVLSFAPLDAPYLGEARHKKREQEPASACTWRLRLGLLGFPPDPVRTATTTLGDRFLLPSDSNSRIIGGDGITVKRLDGLDVALHQMTPSLFRN